MNSSVAMPPSHTDISTAFLGDDSKGYVLHMVKEQLDNVAYERQETTLENAKESDRPEKRTQIPCQPKC